MDSTKRDNFSSEDPDCYLLMAHIRIIFSLGARTLAPKIRRPYLINIAALFLRAPRGKEFESEPLEGSNQGLKEDNLVMKALLME